MKSLLVLASPSRAESLLPSVLRGHVLCSDGVGGRIWSSCLAEGAGVGGVLVGVTPIGAQASS